MQFTTSFRAKNKADLDKHLDAAVATAVTYADIDRLGVLVTRHEFDRFSVALSSTVPFGLIIEQDHIRRKG